MSSVERLRLFFSQHHSLFPLEKPILVACSGGADSVALAWGLFELQQLFPYQFILVHINHHLRGHESHRDEKFVRSLADQLHWPFEAVDVTINRKRGNLEEQARVERYNAFSRVAKQYKTSALLTAHTLNDQAETLVLNLLRGASIDGLSGMPAIRHRNDLKLMLGRPLLAMTKKELESELLGHKRGWRIDSSNADRDFSRNWLRADIFPALEKRFPGFQNRLGQLSSLVREEAEFWDQFCQEILGRVTQQKQRGCLLDFKKLMRYSPPVQRRVLKKLVEGTMLSFEAIENWRAWMLNPPSGARQWQLRRGWRIERLSRSQGASSTKLFLIQKKH